MRHKNKQLFLLIAICTFLTILSAYFIGKIQPSSISSFLAKLGVWGPIIYVLIYTIFTLLILPSTALNLMGGALFGPWIGTLWTTLAALIAALIAFWMTRYGAQAALSKRFSGRWQNLDAELRQGGMFYIAAIRLLPIIPYGLVNYMAGLTSIKFRDYLIGTLVGTLPGVLPFVLLGSSGITALQTGQILPLLLPLSLIGILVGGATWYRHHRGSNT